METEVRETTGYGEVFPEKTFISLIRIFSDLGGSMKYQSNTDKSQVSRHSTTGISWRKTIGSQT